MIFTDRLLKCCIVLPLQAFVWFSDTTFHLHQFLLEKFGSDWSQIMPDIFSQLFLHYHLKWLFSSIGINLFWADAQFLDILDLLLCTGFDSEHTDLFWCLMFTQRPMNDWTIGPNWWARLWSVKSSIKTHQNFNFKIVKNWKLFDSWTELVSLSHWLTRVAQLLPKASLLLLSVTAANSETPVFVIASQITVVIYAIEY